MRSHEEEEEILAIMRHVYATYVRKVGEFVFEETEDQDPGKWLALVEENGLVPHSNLKRPEIERKIRRLKKLLNMIPYDYVYYVRRSNTEEGSPPSRPVDASPPSVANAPRKKRQKTSAIPIGDAAKTLKNVRSELNHFYEQSRDNFSGLSITQPTMLPSEMLSYLENNEGVPIATVFPALSETVIDTFEDANRAVVAHYSASTKSFRDNNNLEFQMHFARNQTTIAIEFTDERGGTKRFESEAFQEEGVTTDRTLWTYDVINKAPYFSIVRRFEFEGEKLDEFKETLEASHYAAVVVLSNAFLKSPTEILAQKREVWRQPVKRLEEFKGILSKTIDENRDAHETYIETKEEETLLQGDLKFLVAPVRYDVTRVISEDDKKTSSQSMRRQVNRNNKKISSQSLRKQISMKCTFGWTVNQQILLDERRILSDALIVLRALHNVQRDIETKGVPSLSPEKLRRMQIDRTLVALMSQDPSFVDAANKHQTYVDRSPGGVKNDYSHMVPLMYVRDDDDALDYDPERITGFIIPPKDLDSILRKEPWEFVRRVEHMKKRLVFEPWPKTANQREQMARMFAKMEYYRQILKNFYKIENHVNVYETIEKHYMYLGDLDANRIMDDTLFYRNINQTILQRMPVVIPNAEGVAIPPVYNRLEVSFVIARLKDALTFSDILNTVIWTLKGTVPEETEGNTVKVLVVCLVENESASIPILETIFEINYNANIADVMRLLRQELATRYPNPHDKANVTRRKGKKRSNGWNEVVLTPGVITDGNQFEQYDDDFQVNQLSTGSIGTPLRVLHVYNPMNSNDAE